MRRVVTIFDDGDVDRGRAGDDGRGGHDVLPVDSAKYQVTWLSDFSSSCLDCLATTCWLGLALVGISLPTTTA